MANATGFIIKCRNDIDRFMEAYEQLRTDYEKYKVLGPEAILAKYQFDPADFSKEDWEAMISSLEGIVNYMDTGASAKFYQAGS